MNATVSEFVVIAPGGYAGFEDHTRGLAGADALSDFVESARGAEGVLDVRWWAFGGRDGVTFYELILAVKLHRRGAYANE